MSHLRRDPTSGLWVIVAPGRSARPQAKRGDGGAHAPLPPYDSDCPFCPGNEAALPSVIAAVPADQPPGWCTRVVPNKYPAVDGNEGPPHRTSPLEEAARVGGVHQVIIETPRHDLDLTAFDDAHLRVVVSTYRDRCRVLMAREDIRSVILFRNRGVRAGASLRHPHAQIVGLDMVPVAVEMREAAMRRHFEREGRCLICDIVGEERARGTRLVFEDGAFVGVVPFAPSVPSELWLLPKRHAADFGGCDENEIAALAVSLRDALARLARRFEGAPYKIAVDTATKGEGARAHLHWRLRIVPYSSVPGGFELGAGMAIIPTLPEADAAALRTPGARP